MRRALGALERTRDEKRTRETGGRALTRVAARKTDGLTTGAPRLRLFHSTGPRIALFLVSI